MGILIMKKVTNLKDYYRKKTDSEIMMEIHTKIRLIKDDETRVNLLKSWKGEAISLSSKVLLS